MTVRELTNFRNNIQDVYEETMDYYLKHDKELRDAGFASPLGSSSKAFETVTIKASYLNEVRNCLRTVMDVFGGMDIDGLKFTTEKEVWKTNDHH